MTQNKKKIHKIRNETALRSQLHKWSCWGFPVKSPRKNKCYRYNTANCNLLISLVITSQKRVINPVYNIEYDKWQGKQSSWCFVNEVSSLFFLAGFDKIFNRHIVHYRLVCFARQVNHFKIVIFETQLFGGTVLFDTNDLFYGGRNFCREGYFLDLQVESRNV